MEEAMTGSHFCHKCYRIVDLNMGFEMVCPFCQSGFIEEFEYLNTARDYDGRLGAICLDCQLVIFIWTRRCFPKEDAFLDLVLPGHKRGHGPDSVCTAEHQESKQAEADPCSSRCYPEPVEVPVPDLSPTDQTSPPFSPSNSDSSMSTPFAVEYDDVDFRLVEYDDDDFRLEA